MIQCQQTYSHLEEHWVLLELWRPVRIDLRRALLACVIRKEVGWAGQEDHFGSVSHRHFLCLMSLFSPLGR